MTHITIEKEKLQKVLEALEDLQRQYSIYPNSFRDWSKWRKAITAIKQALAAPVQEPIYQMQMMDGKWIDQAEQSYEYNKAHGHTVRIVYTSPPTTQPAPELVAEMAQILGGRLAKEQAVYLSMETAKSLVRSMLTTPPAAPVPLTPDELAEKSEARLKFGEVGNIVDAFERGYRQCERDHGITQKGQP